MTQSTRPVRSVLYIPGSKERALDKARGLPADAIIFDLEDAVTPDAKADARATLRAELDKGGFGNRMRIVRINGFDTVWGRQDVEAMQGAEIDALLLPKVNSAYDLQTLADMIPDVPLWAMMETPEGILNAREIAAHPRLAGIVMGTNDLVKELGCRVTPDRSTVMTSLQISLIAARAAGALIVDGVYNAFKDDDGLRAECEQGRDLGFDGKTLIHPAQIDIANELFAPSEADIDLARRQIAAFEEVEASGQGVAVVDGKIVENLHIVTAKALLAKAEAIASLEG
ncbi:(3S)-malyl-CoA thioesterase [Maritimibacter alkaliphilus HTCC2654]|jgi:(3S)-malyl-CoA thioesterase|uniref:Putative citrate lyase beta chain n=1 Tax=Maritimibacter alkaliphilus HTCC2654 TaxID=314271 RepID=A3VBW5_9RHOB|nr:MULTISPECIES: CoA ester lyase [Maritimibacter]EAQ14448.1 Putative citrate lyase beta chain [Rhodobacterales bacterium HTCC2654] [Maritimibacter alkaliphilus HTCC2654]MBL6427179.1 CoA ester lyase [Maritimibacter sp.]TYP82461.1 (3S)-malyl-CoA thioesterase [Maritimibacter alkaliphilus HTCC2654]